MRGATVSYEDAVSAIDISIHAPHAGRDGPQLAALLTAVLFQSTRPMRGATLP